MFPSPVGELHFSMEYTYFWNCGENPFPSPVGELHFSIVQGENSNFQYVYRFPSPVGELHFSIRWNIKYHCSINIVSVPCRGTTFLNRLTTSWSVVGVLVSVPCRGTTFLNLSVYPLISACMFPSPVGELHFSILTIGFKSTSFHISFRPLSGNYISQC